MSRLSLFLRSSLLFRTSFRRVFPGAPSVVKEEAATMILSSSDGQRQSRPSLFPSASAPFAPWPRRRFRSVYVPRPQVVLVRTPRAIAKLHALAPPPRANSSA